MSAFPLKREFENSKNSQKQFFIQAQIQMKPAFPNISHNSKSKKSNKKCDIPSNHNFNESDNDQETIEIEQALKDFLVDKKATIQHLQNSFMKSLAKTEMNIEEIDKYFNIIDFIEFEELNKYPIEIFLTKVYDIRMEFKKFVSLFCKQLVAMNVIPTKIFVVGAGNNDTNLIYFIVNICNRLCICYRINEPSISLFYLYWRV